MSRNILPEPPDELKQMSKSLCQRIREAFDPDGMMPFSRFMEMALYEPGLGYYSAGLHKLGESGDFVTAPELGSLFAACLARQVAEAADLLGDYDLLEAGAGTGRLAADLLRHLPAEKLPARYLVLERSADLRRVQQEVIEETVPALADRVHWLDQPPDADWQGVLIANEVIDALAVERFRIAEDGIEQMCVATEADRFCWSRRAAPEELQRAVQHLASTARASFRTGYRSEVNLHLSGWLNAVTRQMTRGLALFIDYGYPRGEYYLPQRTDGTVMCHYRHRAHDDVFFWPGLQDITAWVDFTALAEAADAFGLEVQGYTSQAMFLLGCGLDELLADEVAAGADDGLALSAQARELTLPGLMGEKFQVMGLGRGLDSELRGFALQDLRYRL
ncbi:MAG: SAM-dependent methyltransferase [Xanthomonadales bacterium]|nr:SAM-dependent methyltransferase [Gammaproteobacteria bacterium]MBT8052846.1 SAM-dependent methyltransferase [Gammaproteobacteria bacterium]NND55693.1 SAM-dependent methyltransferase [Xanthomonadales bacterium]NNK50004.1 SAM-dependent methyltransferase [Xanthomonadales bacterium]